MPLKLLSRCLHYHSSPQSDAVAKALTVFRTERRCHAPTFGDGGWQRGGMGCPWEFRQSNFIVGKTRCILSGNTCEWKALQSEFRSCNSHPTG